MVLQRERRDDPMHRSALVQDVVEIAHADLVSHIRAQVAKYGDTRAYTYLREAGRDLSGARSQPYRLSSGFTPLPRTR